MDKREPIYCTCHGDVVMGYRLNGQIVWYDVRHGEKHFKIVSEAPAPLDNLLQRVQHKP